MSLVRRSVKNRKFDSYRSLHTSVAIFASQFLALHNYGATFSPLTPRYEIKLSVPVLLRWCKRVSNTCFRIAANNFYVTGRVFVIFIYAKFIKESSYSSLWYYIHIDMSLFFYHFQIDNKLLASWAIIHANLVIERLIEMICNSRESSKH